MTEIELIDEKVVKILPGNKAYYMNEYFCSIGETELGDDEIMSNYCCNTANIRKPSVQKFDIFEIPAQCVKKIVMDIDIYINLLQYYT